MIKNIKVEGHIINLKFPYDEDLNEEGLIITQQKEIHPCLIIVTEDIEDTNKSESIIYVAYGTSQLTNEPCSFYSGPNYKDFGLKKETKWIISSHKILRIKIDECVYKKYVGIINNTQLLININRHCNKKNILKVINDLRKKGRNRIPLKDRENDEYWE